MSSVQILTPAGRGAVATVRVEGLSMLNESTALFVAANGVTMERQPINRVCFGRWGSESPEDVVVCRVAEDAAEIHCHGGDAAVERIAGDLEERGCVRMDATSSDEGQLLAQASGDVHPSLVEMECRDAVARATTLRTADILWQQCEGRLAAVLAELEALPSDSARPRAVEMLRWAKFGRHLTEPWRVVLCGRPNVGKSSLINALVGFGRSIVFDQPGTTRDVVTVETALDGWPIEFSDTAGLREGADELESAGIASARRRLETADLRVLVFDTSQPAHADDQRLLEEFVDALIVAHKCDLPNVWRTRWPMGALAASSVTGEGITQLAGTIVKRLVPNVPPTRTMIPVHPRHLALLSRIAGDAACGSSKLH